MDKLDVIVESFNKKMTILSDQFDELVDLTNNQIDEIEVLKDKNNSLTKEYEYLLTNHENIIDSEKEYYESKIKDLNNNICILESEKKELFREKQKSDKKIIKLEMELKRINNSLKEANNEIENYKELLSVNDNAELLKKIEELKKLLSNARLIINEYQLKGLE